MQNADLLAAALDIERHVDAEGWDQPALLFALVESRRILVEQPGLAAELGLGLDSPTLTTFEQEAPPDDQDLDVFLGRIEWPEQIVGAALVVERLVLPPRAEAELADRPDAATVAREHPEARDMRIVVAVGRDGEQMCVLRLRGEADEDVLTGPDLVPGLAAAMLDTFR